MSSHIILIILRTVGRIRYMRYYGVIYVYLSTFSYILYNFSSSCHSIGEDADSYGNASGR